MLRSVAVATRCVPRADRAAVLIKRKAFSRHAAKRNGCLEGAWLAEGMQLVFSGSAIECHSLNGHGLGPAQSCELFRP